MSESLNKSVRLSVNDLKIKRRTRPSLQNAITKVRIVENIERKKPVEGRPQTIVDISPHNVFNEGANIQSPASNAATCSMRTVPATLEENASVDRFMEAFTVWKILVQLWLKTEYYKKQSCMSDFNAMDFFDIDPILLNNPPSDNIFVYLNHIEVPSISNCDLKTFNAKVEGEECEVSVGSDNQKIIRRDTKYSFEANIECTDVKDGNVFYIIHNEDKNESPDFRHGSSFNFDLFNLKIHIKAIITKIDKRFETEKNRFKEPNISFTYDLGNAEIKNLNAPKGGILTDKNKIEELFENYKTSKILNDQTGTARSILNAYLERITPLVVKLKWIHQLFDVMFNATVFKEDITSEYNKLQTRIVEVLYFSVLHKKMRYYMESAIRAESFDPLKKLVYFRQREEHKTVKSLSKLLASKFSSGNFKLEKKQISSIFNLEKGLKPGKDVPISEGEDVKAEKENRKTDQDRFLLEVMRDYLLEFFSEALLF